MERFNKRAANWGEGERTYAVQLILDRSSVLEGKFRGASQGAKEKERIWQEIAADLNASGQGSCLRTVTEIKKMYGNMKSRAKDKHDSNFKTGGGATSTFTPTEEIIISHLLANNKSQLKGLDTGIDSLESQPVPVCSLSSTDDVSVQEVFIGDNLIDSNNNTITVNEVGCSGDGKTFPTEFEEKRYHKKTSKRIRDDKQDELYDLEKKKIQAEIKMIEEKTWQNHELFLINKKILEKQLNA